MTIQLELWHLILLLMSFFGGLAALGRLLLRQYEQRVVDRWDALAGRIDKYELQHDSRVTRMETQQQKLTRELLQLKATLPKDYVGREDWIRFGGMIDHKLDHLRSVVQTLSTQLAGLSTRGEDGGR